MEQTKNYEVVVSTKTECFVIEKDSYVEALITMAQWLSKPECQGREVFVQEVVRTKLLSKIGG